MSPAKRKVLIALSAGIRPEKLLLDQSMPTRATIDGWRNDGSSFDEHYLTAASLGSVVRLKTALECSLTNTCNQLYKHNPAR